MTIGISYERGSWTVFSSAGFVGVTGDREQVTKWVKMLMGEATL